jgi:hypothetical protein
MMLFLVWSFERLNSDSPRPAVLKNKVIGRLFNKQARLLTEEEADTPC